MWYSSLREKKNVTKLRDRMGIEATGDVLNF